MVSVADEFGIELSTAAREAFKKAGFTLVYDKTYPLGTQDMQPILNEAMRLNPDAFVAFSYPPDTLAITDQSRVLGFNPKVFYTGVGTAFPLFKAALRRQRRRRHGHRRLERRLARAQGLFQAPRRR